MMNSHHELNVKDIDITTLKLQNEQLQNNLRREKEIVRASLLKSPRSSNDTLGLGYTSTEEG